MMIRLTQMLREIERRDFVRWRVDRRYHPDLRASVL